MEKEVKKLLAYLLALVIILTSVFNGQKTTAKAATLENDGTEITAESEAPVKITTKAEGKTVYTLTGNVTNGLKITLAEGETVILDGKGYSIHGRDESDSATPALEIAGSGTLILKNANLTGGDGNGEVGFHGQGAVGLRVTSPNVSLILQQTVTITGGTAADGATDGTRSGNGSSGIEFSGAALKVDSGSQVTIKGSDGYQGTSWDKYGDGRFDGTPGGCALNFTGGSLLVRDDAYLTLTGGNGGKGASGPQGIEEWVQLYKKAANGTNGGNGGNALSFTGSVYTVSSSAKVTYTPGTGGTGGAAGTYHTGESETTLESGDAGSDGSAGLKLAYTSGLVSDKTLLQSTLSEGEEVVSVTLHYSDDTQTYYAKKDSTIIPAYFPNTEYCTVSRWYTDESLQTPVNKGETITLTQDTDFYADYTFKVSFSTGEDTISVGDQAVTYPAAVTRPTDPTRRGYTFGGWYEDEACTKVYIFDQPVTKDMTLYAKWTINTYKVSFDSVGGSSVDEKTVDYNTPVTKPEDPTKRGYTFGGWYEDEACTKVYIFDQPVTKDMTLYAKWTINTYKVSFDSVGGSSVDKKTVDYNTAVSQPEKPTKMGYTFGGWYTDEACKNAYNFTAPVTGNMTLYAKWTINTYTVSFDSVGGSSVAEKTVDYNTAVTRPEDPTKTGYTFGGWYTDKACTNAYNFTTPVTKHMILFAKWDKISRPTVTLNVSSLVLQKGKSTTAVKVTLTKSDSIKKWKSSNTKVVTVSQKGKIKAKKTGKAVITVITKRGASASVEIKVQKKKVKTQKLTVTNVRTQKLTLKKGKTFILKTKRTPLTSQEKITFKSSNKKVVNVSKSGKVKAVKKGKTVITVKSGTQTVKVKVTVK